MKNNIKISNIVPILEKMLNDGKTVQIEYNHQKNEIKILNAKMERIQLGSKKEKDVDKMRKMEIATNQNELDYISNDFNGNIIIQDNVEIIEIKKDFENANIEIRNGKNKVMVFKDNFVTAFENSTVLAYDNSSVLAFENSTIMAYNNSSVVAFDNSSVVAYDCKHLEMKDNSTAIIYKTEILENYSQGLIFYMQEVQKILILEENLELLKLNLECSKSSLEKENLEEEIEKKEYQLNQLKPYIVLINGKEWDRLETLEDFKELRKDFDYYDHSDLGFFSDDYNFDENYVVTSDDLQLYKLTNLIKSKNFTQTTYCQPECVI